MTKTHALDAPKPIAARDWAGIVALSILWGGSFFFFKILVTALPPFTLVLGRVGMAALVLNLVIRARGQSLPRTPALWGAFLIMGLIANVVPFSLIAWGEARISSGLAAILNATTPLFTLIVARLAPGGRTLSARQVLGVGSGILGTTILVAPSLAGASGLGDLAGILACLAASVSYGFAGVFGRRLGVVPPLVAATSQLTASTAILLIVAPIMDHPWSLAPPSLIVWAAWIGLALLSTALAYIIYFKVLASAGPTNASLSTLMLPVVSLALGTVFLDEIVTRAAVAGMVLIGLGLLAIDGRLTGLFWRAWA